MDGFVPPVERPDVIGTAEALVRQYGAWLKSKLRLRYGDEADDLAHEALLKTAIQDAAVGVDHPKAFLLRVANNLAVDRARRQRRERASHAASEPLQSASAAPPMEEWLTVKDIVLALPPELRDALVLTKIKGMSHEDVAALKGWKVRTVKDRASRALAIVKAKAGQAR